MAYNKNSILHSVKKVLGIDHEYTAFDPDIIIHINAVLGTLVQIGVGETFIVEDETAEWSDFFGDVENLELIKTYVPLKVRFIFDPPQSSAMDALKEIISEMEFRIFVESYE